MSSMKNFFIDMLGVLLKCCDKYFPNLKNKVYRHQLRRKDLVSWRVEEAKRLGVSVGEGVRLYSLGFYSEPYLVAIGKNTIVSGYVKFVTHDGGVFLAKDKIDNVLGYYGRIKVGDNCFIGMNAIILPNVEIGDNCVIGAGSVISSSISANSVVSGNPAKVIFKTDLYFKLKINSKNTICCADFPFPNIIPDDVKRDLLDNIVPQIPKMRIKRK